MKEAVIFEKRQLLLFCGKYLQKQDARGIIYKEFCEKCRNVLLIQYTDESKVVWMSTGEGLIMV